MASKTIQKYFQTFKGKDIKSSDLTRDPDAASELINWTFTKDSHLVTRYGSRILAPNGQYLGLYTYRYNNLTTGAVQQELLSIGQKLYKLRSNSITIAYSGAAVTANVSIYFSTQSQLHCQLQNGASQVLDYNMGNGLELAPITLANLKTAVDATANFSMTISGTTSTPAALVLPNSLFLDLASSPKSQTIVWYDWQAINETTSNAFGGYFGARGNDAFEIASMVNASNVAYFATGYEYEHKYDGQTVYRSGLPEAIKPTGALVGGGALTGAYSYIVTHTQKDARTNVVEGVESLSSATLNPVTQNIDLTVTNILAGTGFNTNCALFAANVAVAPAAGLVTLTVQNTPHTMKAGDTAFFFNRHASVNAYKEYSVASVTTTTLVLTTGDTVTTNNNDVVSNNLRITIYRTANGGVDYFFVADIPNNSFTANQTYRDSTLDTALGFQYLFPLDGREHGLLNVKPRYLTIHQGQKIAAGALDNPDTVYVSLPEGTEYYAPVAGQFDIVSTKQGGVSALGSDGTSLIIGKENSIYIGNGDFSLPGAFRVEKLSETIGIIANATMQELGAGVIFLSQYGFFQLIGGSRLIEIGEPINPEFYAPVYTDALRLRLKRAIGVELGSLQQYVCFVPTESGTGVNRYATGSSRTFVFDEAFGGWFDWSGLNMAGGLTEYNDEFWWQSKRNDAALTVTGNAQKIMKSGNIYDYADHGEPISIKYCPQWETFGEPSVFKLIPRVRFYSLLRDILAAAFTLRVRTEVDFTPGFFHSDFNVQFGSAGSAGYGYAPYGSSPYGSPSITSQIYKLRVGKLRSMRFCFENANLHQKTALSGWEYELIQTYKKEMK